MNAKITDPAIADAEVTCAYARMMVRDLVQQAYDAGKTSNEERLRVPHAGKPTGEEVNKAITAIERGAVLLAHARMEYVAKACGFEGLTEALGYLQTLRANPIADLLREAVNLAAIGDIYPSDDVAESGGWGNWMKRAKAVVGDKAPPAEEVIGEREPEVLSGCAVRATIQKEGVNGSPPYEADVAEDEARMADLCDTEAADTWDFYGLPRTNCLRSHTETGHGTAPLRTPVYYWAGRTGRPGSRNAQAQLGAPYTAEHVLIDETRGPPNSETSPAFVCRIIESIEPLSLGHTICISREELQPVGDDWKPLPKEPTNRHGQTCAQTCGPMANSGFHSLLCHTVEAIVGGSTTGKH